MSCRSGSARIFPTPPGCGTSSTGWTSKIDPYQATLASRSVTVTARWCKRGWVTLGMRTPLFWVRTATGLVGSGAGRGAGAVGEEHGHDLFDEPAPPVTARVVGDLLVDQPGHQRGPDVPVRRVA